VSEDAAANDEGHVRSYQLDETRRHVVGFEVLLGFVRANPAIVPPAGRESVRGQLTVGRSQSIVTGLDPPLCFPDLIEEIFEMVTTLEVPRPGADELGVGTSHAQISLFVEDVEEQPPLRGELTIGDRQLMQLRKQLCPPHGAKPAIVLIERGLPAGRDGTCDGDQSRPSSRR
jgi:hypothetical protein